MNPVAPNLSIGGWNQGADVRSFTAIVALDYQIPTFGPTLQVRWPIGDWAISRQHDPVRFASNLEAVASFVVALLGAGHHVLILCLQGRNRAALVAAKVLMLQGTDPATALAQVRRGEPGTLTNRDFLKVLDSA